MRGFERDCSVVVRRGRGICEGVLGALSLLRWISQSLLVVVVEKEEKTIAEKMDKPS